MKKRLVSVTILSLALLAAGAIFQQSRVSASTELENATVAILVAEWKDQPEAAFEAYFGDLPDDLRILAHEDGGISYFQPGYQPADGRLPVGISGGQTVQKDIFGPDAATVAEVRAALVAARGE